GRRLGLLSTQDYARFEQKYSEVDRLRQFLHSYRWDPVEAPDAGLSRKIDPQSVKGQTLEVLLRRPEVVLEDLEPVLRARSLWFSSTVRRAVEIDIRYEGYIQQQ